MSDDKDVKNVTYADAVKDAARRNQLADGPGFPVPDSPHGEAVHVNPALNPAPEWKPQPDRVPVPVINDPGVLGGGVPLAEQNRAYRANDIERDGDGKAAKAVKDDIADVTADDIKQASLARYKAMEKSADDRVKDVAEANKTVGKQSKL